MGHLHKLAPLQLKKLSDDLVTAGIALELGGDWREVFRLQMKRHKTGYLHMVYRELYLMPQQSLTNVVRLFTGE